MNRASGKLEPGRELDSLIAEEVMGWKFKHDLYPCGNPQAERCRHCHEVSWKLTPIEPTCKGFPKYSTDIKAAWEIVEKLKPADDEFRLTKYSNNKWECTFAYFETSTERAETAEHAICLAALATIKYKSPSNE